MRFSFSVAVLFVIACTVGCDDLFEGDDTSTPKPRAVLDDSDESTLTQAFITTPVQDGGGGFPRYASLTLSNQGDGVLFLSALRLAADPVLCPAPSTAFTIAAVSIAGLQQGASAFLTVEVADDVDGCAVLEVQTNDPDRPVLRSVITAAPTRRPALCDSSEGRLTFPQTLVGSSSRLTTSVRVCAGESVADIAAVQLEGFPAPFAFAISPTAPFSIDADDSLDLDIIYTPVGTEAVVDFGRIVFVLGDATTHEITLQASSSVSNDCRPVVDHGVLQFPTTVVGNTASLPLRIENRGTTACFFFGVNDAPGPLSVDVAPLQAQLIEPGQTANLNALYVPTVDGDFDIDDVGIAFNGGAVSVAVRLEGHAIASGGCNLVVQGSGSFPRVATGSGSDVSVVVNNNGPNTCFVGEPRIVGGGDEFGVLISTDASDLFVDDTAPFRRGRLLLDRGSFEIQITRRAAAVAGVTSAVLELPVFTFNETAARIFQIPLHADVDEPCIATGERVIDLGAVSANGVVRREISLGNCGGAARVSHVSMVGVSHPGFDVVSTRLDDVIPAGGDLVVAVTAAPDATDFAVAGTSMFGTVEVVVDGVPVHFQVHANAPVGCLDVANVVCSARLLDFGRVRVGEREQLALACENHGAGAVRVEIEASGPFSSPTGPIDLEPHVPVSTRIDFAPTVTGSFEAAVRVSEGGCVQPVFIGLTGEGSAADEVQCATGPVTLRNLLRVTDVDAAQVWTTPLVARLVDTNRDHAITGIDVPGVVVIGFSPGVGSHSGTVHDLFAPVAGVVRAYRGSSGDLDFVTDSADALLASTTPAIADLDGDGDPEIIAVAWDNSVGVGPFLAKRGQFIRGRLVAFNNDGSLRWRSAQWSVDSAAFEDAGAVAVGDVDGDGNVEIAFGDTVFNADGQLRFRGDGAFIGSAGRGPRSFFADVVGDDGLELIAGPRIYSDRGALLVSAGSDVDDGIVALADLDGDGDSELVLRNKTLRAFSIDGATLTPFAAPLVMPTRSAMGASCVPVDDPQCATLPTPMATATVDAISGDDVIVTSGGLVLVYGVADGAFVERQRIVLTDTDGAAPPTAFDVDGDGRFEIVVADNSGYRIVDAAGSERARVTATSVPLLGGVAVADVDGDGHAELVRGNARPFENAPTVTFDVTSGTRLPRLTTIANHADLVGGFTSSGASEMSVDDAVRFRAVDGICAP